MSLIAIVGDCTTTTCVALAAGWPADDDVLVAEADGSGGSLAAWLDAPASPTLATVVANGADAGADTARAASSLTPSGIRLLPAPVRIAAARRAVHEAATTLFPRLAAAPGRVLADAGREGWLPIAAAATTVVVVHRQVPASAAAGAVRLERLVEQVETVSSSDAPTVVVIVGDQPFDPGEVIAYVDGAVPGAIAATQVLPLDPLAAAVLAGRTGVSPRRLARLPLMRAAVRAAAVIRNVDAPSTSRPTRPPADVTSSTERAAP